MALGCWSLVVGWGVVVRNALTDRRGFNELRPDPDDGQNLVCAPESITMP